MTGPLTAVLALVALAHATPQGTATTTTTTARRIDARAISFVVNGRIVLGETSRIEMLVRAVQHDGSPLDVAPPRLATSVGSLGDVERTAAGVWKTTYTPPSAGPPQVAVIVAAIDSADVDAVGFTVLPLWGKGATVVHTKPATDVTVRAGAIVFGPVKANDAGDARVPLELPPGVKTAVTHARDNVGNVADRTIDLGVPPFLRVALIALDEIIVGDGASSARLVAVTVDDNGAPQAAAAAPVVVGASAGSVSMLAEEPAAGLRVVVVKGVSNASSVDVNFALADAKESKARTRIAVIAGAPVGATIKLSRGELRDDDDDRAIEVTTQLIDAGGRPVAPQAAGVYVDVGRIARFQTDDDGTRHISWVIPVGTQRKRATLTVHLPSGQVLATAGFAMLQGHPARLLFEPVRFVVADGEHSTEVAVRAVDKNGTALEPEDIKLTVADKDGALTDTRVTKGAARARLTPTAVSHPTTIPVRASEGAVSESVDVELRAPAPALMVKVGLAAESNYQQVIAAGVDVDVLVRLFASIYAGGYVGVLQSLVRPSAVINHRAIPLMGELVFRAPLSADADLLLGVSAGPVLSDIVESGNRESFELALGGQAVVGVGLKLGSVPLDVAVRAGTAAYLSDSAHADAALGVPLGAALVVAWRFEP